MKVDFHTHVFPPEVIERRAEYASRDATFAELYGEPAAKLATARDLLRSMDEAQVDVSVIQGFAWSDLDDCRRHNDYLLESAERSQGRLIAFCTLQPAAGEAAMAEAERCARLGARGLGELRPENQGYRLVDSLEERLLAEAARNLGLTLLFHVSEPAGHAYSGKQGLRLEDFAAFAERHADIRVVGAHWAGGLPFYALMPEVAKLAGSVWCDTAATSLLYSPEVFGQVASTLGADRILFGSDHPLLSQKKAVAHVRGAGLSPEDADKVLGGNAARLLGLE